MPETDDTVVGDTLNVSGINCLPASYWRRSLWPSHQSPIGTLASASSPFLLRIFTLFVLLLCRFRKSSNVLYDGSFRPGKSLLSRKLMTRVLTPIDSTQ